jgi:hypothetical protein
MLISDHFPAVLTPLKKIPIQQLFRSRNWQAVRMIKNRSKNDVNDLYRTLDSVAYYDSYCNHALLHDQNWSTVMCAEEVSWTLKLVRSRYMPRLTLDNAMEVWGRELGPSIRYLDTHQISWWVLKVSSTQHKMCCKIQNASQILRWNQEIKMCSTKWPLWVMGLSTVERLDNYGISLGLLRFKC